MSGTSGTPGKPDPVLLSIPVPLRLFPAPPAGPGPGRPPILLAMHGFAMSALPMLGLARQFAPPGFLIVSVQGPQSAFAPGTSFPDRKIGFHFGVSPDAEDNRAVHRAAVAAAIGWASENGGDPGRVSLAGFSHPCSFNYRLALDPPHGAPFRAVVGICGGLPGEWGDDAPPGTPASKAAYALHVSTTEDEWYSAETIAPYGRRLGARFATAEHLVFEGPHRAPSAAFPAIREFLAARG